MQINPAIEREDDQGLRSKFLLGFFYKFVLRREFFQKNISSFKEFTLYFLLLMLKKH